MLTEYKLCFLNRIVARHAGLIWCQHFLRITFIKFRMSQIENYTPRITLEKKTLNFCDSYFYTVKITNKVVNTLILQIVLFEICFNHLPNRTLPNLLLNLCISSIHHLFSVYVLSHIVLPISGWLSIFIFVKLLSFMNVFAFKYKFSFVHLSSTYSLYR